MSSTNNGIYLITGANRGIGRAILEQLVARDRTIVVASVRSISHETVQSLETVSRGQDSHIVVVKIDSKSETDAETAVRELQQKHGITRLDAVIANAGISEDKGPLRTTQSERIRAHMDVNFIGPLLLAQASLPLLSKSSHPKFVALGSIIGSISDMEKRPVPMFTYGVSKAALHYLVRKLHCEHPEIISFAVYPGFVQSDMGNKGARALGMMEAPVSLADSASFITSQIDQATRDRVSGKFPSISGGFAEW